jgi:hypothetical protein
MPRRSFKITGCVLAMVTAIAFFAVGGCAIFGGKALPEAPITYSKESGLTPDQLLPEESLRKAFARYWGLRFAGEVEKAFAMEAPYFQEMVGINRYRLFVEGTRKNKLIDIEIRSVDRKTDHFYEIQCRPRFKTPEREIKEIYIVDRWVDVDGTWFHVLKDSVVFPAAS